MKKHKKKLIWGGFIIGVIVLMLLGGREGVVGTWEDTEVTCLPGGHQNALTHIHANLSVVVDGEEQAVPANTGVSVACMAEIHTHTADGEIHVETPSRSANRTLTEFFAVWGESLEREGYDREIMVNGESASPTYGFTDGDRIEVSFTSVATSTQATSTEPTATSSQE
jgi:hypothetical protein